MWFPYSVHSILNSIMKIPGIQYSVDLCRTLCGHSFQLYHKERSQLSPIEVELKFFSPLAANWDIQVWTAEPRVGAGESQEDCRVKTLNTSLTGRDV